VSREGHDIAGASVAPPEADAVRMTKMLLLISAVAVFGAFGKGYGLFE
jgi:hypothetical protein